MLTIARSNSSTLFQREFRRNGFLVLPENRSSVRALRRIIGAILAGKRPSYCPLVLHGVSGTGKSLLVSAALNVLSRDTSGITARSVAAGELSRAGGEEGIDDDGLRTCDVLVIEDIQHMPGKIAAAACDLIDHRTARKKPIVVTTSAGPASLNHLSRRLTSRLAAGLVMRLEPLGQRSRRLILRHAARADKTWLMPDAMQWLLQHSNGLRSALGLLQNLKQLARRIGPIDRKAVEEIVKGSGQPAATGRRTETIVKRVAREFSISEKELLGTSRLRRVLLPRQVAMYLTRELTTLSLPQIGAFFADRDHTTVLHACRKVKAEMQDNEALAASVRQVRQELSWLSQPA